MITTKSCNLILCLKETHHKFLHMKITEATLFYSNYIALLFAREISYAFVASKNKEIWRFM